MREKTLGFCFQSAAADADLDSVSAVVVVVVDLGCGGGGSSDDLPAEDSKRWLRLWLWRSWSDFRLEEGRGSSESRATRSSDDLSDRWRWRWCSPLDACAGMDADFCNPTVITITID